MCADWRASGGAVTKLKSDFKVNSGFEAVEALCSELLTWVDPEYCCSMVAVTKNFQGSPHTDHLDVAFQYAVSLGDFNGGGELCVEDAKDPVRKPLTG